MVVARQSADEVREALLKAGWPVEIVKAHIDQLYRDRPVGDQFLSVRGLSKSFGTHKILDNVQLEIVPGEVFGIIGQSGSGKTTLLSLLVGFLEPDSGDVLLRTGDGVVSVFTHPDVLKRWVGFAAQVPSCYDHLTVRENLEHFAALHGVHPGKRRTDSLVHLVGLDDASHTLTRNLSGGQKKRLDIACALVHGPKALILDEPTADLDVVTAGAVWELVRVINARGTTVILASHFVQELERVCTRIGVLRDRKVLSVGTPDELRALYTPYHEVIVETVKANYDSLMRSLKSAALAVRQSEVRGRSLFIITTAPDRVLQHVLRETEDSGDGLVRLTVQRPTVQDVFEVLVRR